MRFWISALLVFAISGRLIAATPSAVSLIEGMEQTLWSDSSHGRSTMRIESEYWTRELQLEAWMERPEVEAATPRVVLRAMVANPGKSLPVELVGIAPEQERAVTELSGYVEQGTYAQPGEKGIVIGQKLAEVLNARLGDKLVITVQQAGGDLASSPRPSPLSI